MGKITVRFYGLIRQVVGTHYVYLEADNLEETVKQLEKEFGARLREQFGAFGFGQNSRLSDYFVLPLNGRSVGGQESGRINLAPGDIIHIFLPASGG